MHNSIIINIIYEVNLKIFYICWYIYKYNKFLNYVIYFFILIYPQPFNVNIDKVKQIIFEVLVENF